jgi:lysylphosphatidylglycerol synthetase-like protein (DUF2156 family)
MSHPSSEVRCRGSGLHGIITSATALDKKYCENWISWFGLLCVFFFFQSVLILGCFYFTEGYSIATKHSIGSRVCALCLTSFRTVVTMYTICFDIKKFSILSTVHLCVSNDCQNKWWFSSSVEVTDWSLYWRSSMFCVRNWIVIYEYCKKSVAQRFESSASGCNHGCGFYWFKRNNI